jgi:copper chaperone CopZ
MEEAEMAQATLTVPRISCGHCVRAIQNELGEMEGVKKVEGDPGAKTIRVDFDPPASLDAIRELLKEINYPATDKLF